MASTTLSAAINDLDATTQAAVDEIATLAELALLALESQAEHARTLAAALRSILDKAWSLENDGNAHAERVGCNYRGQCH
jgi:hypothetical protein